MTKRSVVSIAAVAGVFLISSSTAFGQAQTDEQQACINKVNRAGTAVAKQQGKEHYACLRAAGKNDLVGTAQDCLTADLKGRVAKKEVKTGETWTKYCQGAGDPDYGFTGVNNTNFSAETAEIQLIADVFGPNLDAAVINCETDDASKAACGCQQKVLKAVDALAAKKAAEFLRCKKEHLETATSATTLANCVEDAGTELSIAADTKLRIAKGIAGLDKAITKGCIEKAVTMVGVFPADCDNLTGVPLRDCLDTKVECRVCQMINDIDGTWVNCDAFDDGIVNASCASGVGPVPTPTPLPPVFGSGPTIKGALLKSSGTFTYNAMNGLAGADSLCNATFAGTHACTYAELLTAESGGELVGAVDTGANVITSFWVIDAAEPDTTQCVAAGLDWNYATGHNGNGGKHVTLDNGTGDLGAPTSFLFNCTNQRWVGCCL